MKGLTTTTSLILLTALAFTVSVESIESVEAADNQNFDERTDTRTDTRTVQRPILPENGINALTTPAATQQPRISRRQATNIASSRYEGRVVGITMDSEHWRVRMDQEGTIFNVFVHANSGAINASSE